MISVPARFRYRFCKIPNRFKNNILHIVIGSGNRQNTAQSQPNIKLAKYSGEARFGLQSLIDPEAIGCVGETASEQLMTLVRASVAAATWRKYESGWRAFCHFELDTETYYEWPLPPAAYRGFAVWCFCTKNLQPTTIKAYVSAIKFAHRLKGLVAHDTKDDPVYQLIVTGARNLGFLQVPKPFNRRVVTFPLLLALGHRIADTPWEPLSKQVVWAAATTAFFSSARMGELLATTPTMFDPVADLTWSDVRFSEGSVMIHLKVPKSGDKDGEFLDLFPFPGYNCCPVKSLEALWNKQSGAGMSVGADPVFRFNSGKNLTPRQFNEILAYLLGDICGAGNIVSCHSFRAGVPSTLSTFPELANSEDIKGWGRWNSDCYTKYTRLRLDQRAKIFTKIADALRKVV